MTDLMAWNADATRMPYRMHSEYLRRLFLDNDSPRAATRSAAGRSRSPTSACRSSRVGTERDHVAPWRSVYKIHLLTDTEVTFVLTSGGHNAGIVSEPGHPRRSYQSATKREGDVHVDPGTWAGGDDPARRLLVAGMESTGCSSIPATRSGRRRWARRRRAIRR